MAQLTVCQQLATPTELAARLQVQQALFERSLGQQYLLSLLRKTSAEEQKASSDTESDRSTNTTQHEPMHALNGNESNWPVSCISDSQYLNPIHCFVRRHVEFFVADEDDIKAPSPGRKVRAVLGQVGIRCIHCKNLPSKERVKRSVCYPPSIGGIYHAVSNIKCDHFALCKGLPEAEREEFFRLRTSGKRKTTKSKKGSSSPENDFANSTAQYYHDSALRMGLIDTKDGIRRMSDNCNDSETSNDTEATESPEEKNVKVPDGISALVNAATDLASGQSEFFNTSASVNDTESLEDASTIQI